MSSDDLRTVPSLLYVRTSRSNPQTYEVVTEQGEVLAAEVPDLNCAEVFAASPLLMEALATARDELARCVSDGDVPPDVLERLMDCLASTDDAARAMRWLLPIA